MGVEELGLGLAAISSLSVPPAGAVAIEVGSGRSLDGNVRSRDRDQRTGPLLVAKGGLTFKDDLDWRSVGHSYIAAGRASHRSSLVQTSQIKSGSRWNSDGGEDDSRTRSFRLDGGGGTLGAGESTSGRALLNFRCTSGSRGGVHGSSTQQADHTEFKTDDHDGKNE